MRRAVFALILVAGCDKPAAPAPPPPDPDPVVEEEVEPDAAAFELSADAPTNKSECDERVSYANSAIKRAHEEAAIGCRRDQDCILVTLDTGCQGACQGAINSMHEDKYKSMQTAIDDKVCKGYRTKNKCPYATPRCVNGSPKCNYDTCEFEMGEVNY